MAQILNQRNARRTRKQLSERGVMFREESYCKLVSQILILCVCSCVHMHVCMHVTLWPLADRVFWD